MNNNNSENNEKKGDGTGMSFYPLLSGGKSFYRDYNPQNLKTEPDFSKGTRQIRRKAERVKAKNQSRK